MSASSAPQPSLPVPVPLSIGALLATITLLLWAAVRVFNRGEDDSSLGATRFNWRR